ncbi:MAG: hypothetical protein V1820_01195 [archaeon]
MIAGRRKGAIEITITAVVAAVIALAVLFIVVGYVAPDIKMMLNNGTEIQGKKYLEIQSLQKLCAAWRDPGDYLDTIDLGVAKAFSDIGLSKESGDNLACADQKRDYVTCVKKCSALEGLVRACAERQEGCYAVGGKYFQRCDTEGCILPGGLTS